MRGMRRLRDSLLSSHVGRPFANATGIASLLALAATLLLWGASHWRLFALSGGLPNDHRFLWNAWRGRTTLTVAAVSEGTANSFPKDLRLRTVEIKPADASRLWRQGSNSWFRFRILQSKQLPLQLKLPLWLPAACFAGAFIASPRLPVRFSVRALFALLTLGCLLLGGLAFVVHRAS